MNTSRWLSADEVNNLGRHQQQKRASLSPSRIQGSKLIAGPLNVLSLENYDHYNYLLNTMHDQRSNTIAPLRNKENHN